MIIIPDIHGRSFWKDAVKGREDEKIVFLGDYVDPYKVENIKPETVIENLKEIIEFKKAHMLNVTLLLGNHDFMTYISPEMGFCRTDFANAPTISKLFADNYDLFKVAMFTEFEGVNYMFSHAGFRKMWTTDPKVVRLLGVDGEDICDVACRLNAMWLDKDPNLFKVLDFMSWVRGGEEDAGSCVWADVREHKTFCAEFDGWFQVFGHSQQFSKPVIDVAYACLDCRQAFEIVDENFVAITKPDNLYGNVWF